MFLKTMNFFLPILTPAKLYGMELETLQKKMEKNRRALRKLNQEQIYLHNRVEGLNSTLAALAEEAQAAQREYEPPDPTEGIAPVVNYAGR